MKRTADRQITKDDGDDRDDRKDNESAGAEQGEGEDTNHKASAEVMAQRRVVRARRNDDGSWKSKTTAASAAPGARAADEEAAGVEQQQEGKGGLTTSVAPTATASEPAVRANPFAGIQLVAPSTADAAKMKEEATQNADASSNGTQHEPPPAASTDNDDVISAPATGTADDEPSNSEKGDAGAVPTTAPAPAELPKRPTTIFGSASGFSGFGSVAKAAGFSGFGTVIPAASSGGFGSSTLSSSSVARSADGSTNPSTSIGATKFVFGSGVGFGGFATAVPSNPSGGFTFRASTVASEDSGAAAGKDQKSASSPTKENDTVGDEAPEGDAPSEKGESTGAKLPTDYELISGEESEKILLELRCRTYRWGPQPQASASAANDVTKSNAAGAATLSVPPSASSAFVSDAQPEVGATKEADSSASGPTAATASATAPSDGQQPTGKWHEAGIGPLRILLNPATNGLRLVQRRESTINGPATNVVWNVTLWKESVVKSLGDRHVQVSSFLGTGDPVLILCKCATPANASDLHALLQCRVPDLRSAEATASDDDAAAATTIDGQPHVEST